MKSILIVFFLVVTLFTSMQCYADNIESTDKMSLTVKVDVAYSSIAREYEYKYTVISHEDSVLDLDKFMVEYEGENPEVIAPHNWKKELSRTYGANRSGVRDIAEYRSSNNKLWVTWQASPEDRIKPNSNKDGFTMKTKGVPGIVTHYAKGYIPPPTTEELAKMTKQERVEQRKIFTNTITGKTLGPVLSPIRPPAKLSPTLFTNTIIGYLEEASQLGWISDVAVAANIKDKLSNVKENIGKDNIKARETLRLLLEELEEKYDKGINDDAYFLIKYNVIHLKNKIEL